jgi:pyruvate,water dikinase
MRLCRTRAYGAVKDHFSEIGKMMANDGVIAVPDDVFYLTINDLKAYCANGNRDDKTVFVDQMKTQYAAWAHLHLPDRIMYTGDTLPVFAAASSQSQSQEQRYSGIAVSQGRVVAEAIVITEPELDTPVKGKILITKMTDPGWIFLMAQAAGLVSEKGSLLSHTAIVGRELGIPVVVGIPGVTTFFKSGDMVGLDGDAGVVWRA